MTELNGTDETHDLGLGITITAPGIVGTVHVRPDLSHLDVDSNPALTEDEQVNRVIGSIFPSRRVLDAQVWRGIDGSASDGLATLALDSPPSGAGVVMVADSDPDGIVTFHSAERYRADRALAADEAVEGDRLTFTIPLSRLVDPPRDGEMTDLAIPAPVKKIITFLFHDVAEMAVREAAEWLADRWEDEHRPYELKRLDVGEPGKSAWAEFPVAGWPDLQDKKVLLLFHGIFSTVESAFGGLDGLLEGETGKTPYQLLAEKYDHIIGWNHPSVSVDPLENAIRFSEHVGTDVVPTVDVLCHSRGGLVARLVAGEQTTKVAASVTARQIVFAGTPNSGTVLVEPDNLEHLINRFVNLLRWIPPGPWSAAKLDVEGFLHLVKFIGMNIEEGLPGLVYMSEENMKIHNKDFTVTGSRHAIGANFEPTDMAKRLLDTAEDRLVFANVDNDVAVPTAQVNVGEEPPVTTDRGDTWHGTYFKDPQVRAQLLEWLQPI
ncbi:DUF7379 domain-containing protein [Aeromicrobium sp.]|uniref:DUF7379 domain-containing protein n=1 Tax=Aeromicrobium sp. TaxID=1871063 RepID=UPI002FCC5072